MRTDWPRECSSALSILVNEIARPITNPDDVSYPECMARSLSALHSAVRENRLSAVKTLIANEAELDILDGLCRTPLIIAAELGLADIVQALLDAGADPYHSEASGRTAAASATLRGHYIAMRVLVDALPMDMGLQSAADARNLLNQSKSPRQTSWLVSRGLDPLKVSSDTGECAFHSLLMTRRQGQEPHVSYILNTGLARFMPPGRRNLLVFAVSMLNLRLLRLLCRALDKEVVELYLRGRRDGVQRQPLWVVAFKSGPTAEIVKLLLAVGADLEGDEPGRGTPLMAACAYGRTANVRLLVRAGARLQYTSDDGTAWSALAACRMYPAITRWLLVERFTEQGKLACAAHWEENRTIKAWSGVMRVELRLPASVCQLPGESLFDYACQLDFFARLCRGEVLSDVPSQPNRALRSCGWLS